MNFKIRTRNQIICLMLLLVPLITVPIIQTYAYANYMAPFTTTDTDVFVENFDNDLLIDAVSDVFLNAGTVTNQRDFVEAGLDFYATTSPIRDLEVEGRKVYAVAFSMTIFSNSVYAFDITDPANIKFLSARNSLTGLSSCDMDGDVFYGGVRDSDFASNSLAIYNVSRPYNLFAASGVYEGATFVDGAVTDIDAEGFNVYFTSYNDTTSHGLNMIFAQDPDNPILYQTDWLTTKALGLEVTGHYAFIAASDDGLYALNVSNKYSAIQLDHLALPGNATDVLIDGTIAYVSLGPGGIAAVDIADPSNLQLLTVFDLPGYYRHMTLQGNTLYATAGAAGVRVIDVVDPTHLSLVHTIITPFAWDVELFGSILVVGTDDGIHTFQISAAGGGLTNIQDFIYANSFSDFEVWDVEVRGDIAYIAGGNDGLYTLNVKDPMNPILLGHWTNGNDGFYKITVDGQFAHCGNGTGQFIFDVSNPSNIRYLDMIIGNDMYDIMAVGGFAHVALYGVYGIGNSTCPTMSTVYDSLSIPVNLTSVFVHGRTTFVGEDAGATADGIYSIDIISSPTVIDVAGGLTSNIWDLYVDGDILYVANGRWLHTYNVSNPYAMVFRDYINWLTDETMKGVHPFGTTLVVAKNQMGVGLIDVADITDITQIAEYTGITSAKQIEVAGDLAFVANRDSLLIFRLFESAADTYIPGTDLVQSASVFTMPNGTISAATLVVDTFTLLGPSITFEMTADGTNWEEVTPGVLHTFTNPGTDLRWRAYLEGDKDRSVHLYQVEIEYEFEYKRYFLGLSPLWLGIIFGGGGGLLLIILIIVIAVVATKKKKAIQTR
ncbi:MAG: hypothetical protein FK734_00660 [Asgard group archaeon]|nr:hypothetical protein [Asgard group archaeon]